MNWILYIKFQHLVLSFRISPYLISENRCTLYLEYISVCKLLKLISILKFKSIGIFYVANITKCTNDVADFLPPADCHLGNMNATNLSWTNTNVRLPILSQHDIFGLIWRCLFKVVTWCTRGTNQSYNEIRQLNQNVSCKKELVLGQSTIAELEALILCARLDMYWCGVCN